jgi:hypothetical protein
MKVADYRLSPSDMIFMFAIIVAIGTAFLLCLIESRGDVYIPGIIKVGPSPADRIKAV